MPSLNLLREMVTVGDEADLRERMRLGMITAIRRLGTVRQVSGTSLVALLCASALAPVVAAGVVVGPVLLAGVGVVGAVGAGVLTEIVTDAIDRLRRDGTELTQASVEKELILKLEEELGARGNSAAKLREAVAALIRGIDAIAAMNEAGAVRDHSLMLAMAEGFTELDERFSEFTPVVEDMRQVLWDLQEAARQQDAHRRVELARAREDSLMLLQMRDLLQRWGRSTTEHADPGDMDPMWSGCPYKGLLPFEERDAQLFYGRHDIVQKLVQSLLERLEGKSLVLVVGASGAGKSSLLRAGLMPSLAAGVLGPGSEVWPRRVIRPTNSPMRELSRHLADMAGLDPVGIYKSLSESPGETPLVVDQAVRTAVGLGKAAETETSYRYLAAAPQRLILIVDQFEEIFTEDGDSIVDRRDRDAFVTALHAAASVPVGSEGVPGALVVVVVRADFLDRTVAYPPFAAAVQEGPFTVGPMSETELRDAITGPAAEAGLKLESDLVDAVVSELRVREGGRLVSGALPLLSQAMAATWERREGCKLTLRAYQRSGRIADSVNRSAQSAYRSLTRSEKEAARLLFISLTLIGQDGQFARRRCSRAELYLSYAEHKEDVDAVIRIFSSQRLIVLGQDDIEISHDALLESWTKLREWLGADRLDRTQYSQVVSDADTWDSHRRDPSYLYRSNRLAAIEAAADRWTQNPRRYPPLPHVSEAFIRAARSAQQRSAQRRRLVICGLIILSLAAITFAGIAGLNAVTSARMHTAALARQLVAESQTTDLSNPRVARQLAVAAWSVSNTSQAYSSMTILLEEQQQDGMLPATSAQDGVRGVAFSPDGKATGNRRCRRCCTAVGRSQRPSRRPTTPGRHWACGTC